MAQHEATHPAVDGLMRLKDVIGDRARGHAGLFPVSEAEWKQGVREGRYPRPVRIPGSRMSFYRRRDVLALVASATEGAAK